MRDRPAIWPTPPHWRHHRHVGNIHGRGLFWAIGLVQDRASRQVFDPEPKFNNRVIVAPPYICRAEDIGRIVDRLGAAVDAALESA